MRLFIEGALCYLVLFLIYSFVFMFLLPLIPVLLRCVYFAFLILRIPHPPVFITMLRLLIMWLMLLAAAQLIITLVILSSFRLLPVFMALILFPSMIAPSSLL